MFLFWRLILAHLIGDFVLQTDKVFVIKQRYSWGVLVHASIAGVLSLLFAGRYLGYPEVFVGLVLLWISHFLIDKAKLLLNRKLQKERVDLFLVDQGLHIGLIWLLVQIVSEKGSLPINVVGFSYLYNNDVFIKLLCGYITVTYGVMVFIYSVKSTLGVRVELPPIKQRLIGFLQRGAIVTSVMLGGLFYLLIPVILVLSALLFLGKNWRYGKLDFALSVILSLLIGVLLSQFIT